MWRMGNQWGGGGVWDDREPSASGPRARVDPAAEGLPRLRMRTPPVDRVRRASADGTSGRRLAPAHNITSRTCRTRQVRRHSCRPWPEHGRAPGPALGRRPAQTGMPRLGKSQGRGRRPNGQTANRACPSCGRAATAVARRGARRRRAPEPTATTQGDGAVHAACEAYRWPVGLVRRDHWRWIGDWGQLHEHLLWRVRVRPE